MPRLTIGSFVIVLLTLGLLWGCATGPSPEEPVSSSRDPNIDRCFSLVEAGNYRSAIPACQAALETSPDAFIVHISYARALANTGDLPGAEAAYRRAMEIEPASIQALEELGDLMLADNRSEEALQAFYQVESIKGDYPANLTKIAGILKSEKRYGEAVNYYKKAILVQPENVSLYVETAETMAAGNNRTGARALMNDALKTMPDSVYLHYSYGVLLQQWRDDAAAIGQYRKVKKLDPGYRKIGYTLAGALFRAERISEAESELRGFMATEAPSADTHVLMGRIKLESSNTAGAEKSFRKAIQVDPGNGTAWVILGNILKNQDKKKEAIEAYRQALRINPNDRIAKKNLKRLAGGGGF